MDFSDCSSRAGDLKLLEDFLALPVDDSNDFPEKGSLSDSEHRAFESMQGRLGTSESFKLTEKQRAWGKNVLERATDNPEYLNLASSGKLCRGREVETPEVLKNLPKVPPGRLK